MICPFALWKPVLAHGGPFSGTILGVVEHVTAGEGDPFNEFANPANKVSSHFGILNGQGGTVDGRLEQYVDTANQSWAQMGGNATYISVETEGQPTEPLTPAQVATFGKLMAWCHDTHGVPLVVANTVGQRGLITHGAGGLAWGGHFACPGDLRKAQRPAILAAASPQPVPMPTQEEEEMPLYTVMNGTGYVIATDLSSKKGIPDAADATMLLNTGLYHEVILDALLVASIPGT